MIRRRGRLLALGTGLALTASLATGAPGATATPGADPSTATDRATDRVVERTEDRAARPTITLRNGGGRTLPAALVGGNLRWSPDGDRRVVDPQGDLRPGVLEASQQLRLGSVRYPGGTVANMFDLTAAIGPQAERGCQTGAGFASTPYKALGSTYGLHEHMDYLQRIGQGVQANILVPMVNRTAQDAGDWVRYMLAEDGPWAARRAENGRAAPWQVRYWEVGNEPYLPNQRYWRSTDLRTRMEQYVRGGTQWQQPAPDNGGTNEFEQNRTKLFSPDGCDLATPRPTVAGEADQVLRVRYGPINTGRTARKPSITFGDQRWTWVPDLADAGPDARVFTVVGPDRDRVRFGDGTHGAIPPGGRTPDIAYLSGPHPGYAQIRTAMRRAAGGEDIQVCASWGQKPRDRADFIRFMEQKGYAWDCLAKHSYAGLPAADDDRTVHREISAQEERLTAELADLDRRSGKRPIIVTEFGHLASGEKNPDPELRGSWMSVLYGMGLQLGQARLGVRLASTSNWNTPFTFEGNRITGLSNRGQAMRLLSLMRGQRLGPASAEPNPRIGGDGYRFRRLSTLATCGRVDGAVRRSLYVINRDVGTPWRGRVQLPGTGGSWTVRQSVLTDGLASRAAREPRVTTRDLAAPSASVTLPGRSISLLEFTGRGAGAVGCG